MEIDVSSIHERKKVWPIFTSWCNAGLTLEQIDEAVTQARKQAKQPIAFLPSYVDRVLASQAQGSASTTTPRTPKPPSCCSAVTSRR
ncbi:hypothetical protein AWV80_01270 [Cupriavidus sp. UYMU48A]|nr:hypothetical protein AWV80_01270 [Cupriavidus sp. UYMU48A]